MDMIIRLFFFCSHVWMLFLYVQVCLIISRKWKEEETYPVMDMHYENIRGFTGDLLDSMLHVNSKNSCINHCHLRQLDMLSLVLGAAPRLKSAKEVPLRLPPKATRTSNDRLWGVSLLHPSLISHGDSAAVLLGTVPVIVSTMPNLVRYRDSQICRAE